jgi:hypothetical protein
MERKWEVGMRKWEKKEGGKVGRWEIGIWKSECGSGNFEFGSGKRKKVGR